MKKNIESEIIKDFKGIYKNRSTKLGFIKKYSKIDLYVSKETGFLIPAYFYKSEKNLNIWNQRYKKKKYTSISPHFLSRHMYTVAQVSNNIRFKNLKIADLGCGDGGLISIVSKHYEHKEIYGFEASKQNIELNKKKFKSKKIKFVHSSIENIDEKKYKKKFDIIFLTWTLSATSEPLKILEKISKIVKKNGHVVIAESSRILVPPTYTLEYYFQVGQKVNTLLNYPWRFSFNSLRNLLLLFNFKTVAFNDYAHNDNLVIIAKKTSFGFKDYKFDTYKNIHLFFKKWIEYSKMFKKLKS